MVELLLEEMQKVVLDLDCGRKGFVLNMLKGSSFLTYKRRKAFNNVIEF